jgi:hypothetical protein
MNVALVEHRQDDVDGDERRRNQDRLAAKRILVGLCSPGEFGLDCWRGSRLRCRLVRGIYGIAERDARLQIERNGDRRKETLCRRHTHYSMSGKVESIIISSEYGQLIKLYLINNRRLSENYVRAPKR